MRKCRFFTSAAIISPSDDSRVALSRHLLCFLLLLLKPCYQICCFFLTSFHPFVSFQIDYVFAVVPRYFSVPCDKLSWLSVSFSNGSHQIVSYRISRPCTYWQKLLGYRRRDNIQMSPTRPRRNSRHRALPLTHTPRPAEVPQ